MDGLSFRRRRSMQCEKPGVCNGEVFSSSECGHCTARYFRCSEHGGQKGANRSLGAHKGICPKRPVSR